MDKNTLSNYGWIVIAVLVLSVMIALATPFGGYIKDAVWSTTEGLFDTSENALGVLGLGGNNGNTNDEEITDAVGSMDSSHTITLDSSLPADTYTLKYENTNSVLTDYADICSLESGASYDDFIMQNTAPQTATKIGVYSSSGERVGSVAFASTFKPNLGNKLYSFGALADVHIGYSDNNTNNFNNALTYLNETENVALISINGDLCQKNSEQLEEYKNIINSHTKSPIYSVSGNHEGMHLSDVEANISEYTGRPLYYSIEKGNDVFIFVGNVSNTKGSLFAEGELQWLYETLEANKNKRCFVFQHIRPNDGSGNATNNESGIIWGGAEAEAFESLMSHYNNALFFHAHSHDALEVQSLSPIANIDSIRGSYSIHIPGFASVDDGIINGNNKKNQGYVVEVYENGILLKGIDFANKKFLPIANYYLNTTLKNITTNTFIDETGYINDSRETVSANFISGKAPYTYGDNIGTLKSMSGLYTTDIIPLEDGYEYIIIGTELKDGCYPVWYNANGGYISGEENSGEGWKAGQAKNRSYTLNPPEGAAMFRLAGASGDLETFKKKIKIKRVPDESKIYGSVSFAITTGVKLSETTGDVAQNHERWSHSDYIRLDPTKSYILRSDAVPMGATNTTVGIIYYNTDKTFNSYSHWVLGPDTGKDIEQYELDIPANAEYIRIRIWHQTNNNANYATLYTLIEK